MQAGTGGSAASNKQNKGAWLCFFGAAHSEMKQRIFTAVVGLTLLLVVLFFFDTWFFNAAIALLSGIAVFEIFQAAGYLKNRPLSVLCFVFVLLVPFFRTPGFNLVSRVVILVYVLGLFAIMLYQHETTRFDTIGTVFTVSVLVPFALSSMIYMRDQFDRDGLFYIMLVFAGAWFADAGGYFIGRFFGRHKLAPKVSPHKTVEGAVGGVLFNIIFFLLMGLGYYFYQRQMGTAVEIHYLQLGLLGAVSAVISILGDLSASLVKRQCGVKDFGTIFPGHGGVMDRFDSVLFVAPFLYVALQAVTLVS